MPDPGAKRSTQVPKFENDDRVSAFVELPTVSAWETRARAIALSAGLVVALLLGIGARVVAPTSLLVAFVFLVLDRIGDIIQDPFTTNFNGLPLAAICRTIEVDLRRQLGETDVPPLLTAQRVPGGHNTSVLL